MSLLELSCVIRSFYISAIGQAVGLAVCSTMMHARRSVWKLYAFTLTKTLLGILVIDLYLEKLRLLSDVNAFYSGVFSMILSILTCLMFAYTYQGGFVKAAIGMSLGEIVTALITMPPILLLNLAEKSENLYIYYKPVEVMDFLLIPFTVIAFGIIYTPVRGILKKYRGIRFKRTYLWAGFLILYFVTNQLIIVKGFKSNSTSMIIMYVSYLLYALLMAVVGYLAYWNYQRRVSFENEFLGAQLNLVGTHYTAIQSQMEKIVEVQNVMEAQMKRLQTQALSEENTADYLTGLQSAYKNIRAGVYCKDWMVDGILYCQEEAAKKLGIHVEYQFGGYERGTIREEDVARLVYLLLNEGIQREAKKISLRTGMIKGQFLVELTVEQMEKYFWFSKRNYRDLLKKYDGSVMVEKEKDRLRAVVTLQG